MRLFWRRWQQKLSKLSQHFSPSIVLEISDSTSYAVDTKHVGIHVRSIGKNDRRLFSHHLTGETEEEIETYYVYSPTPDSLLNTIQECFPIWTSRHSETKQQTNKLHGLSPRANYTDRATAACRRSDCQILRIEGAMWSAWRIPTAVFSVF
jgi:hypothetical protein